MGKHTANLRRFAGHDIDPSQVRALSPDHAALSEGRTIFPSTVVPTLESPRLLVSGHSNPKLGKEITKGPRKGWPIFQLTLEERATCPRSCHQWSGCYGSGMHQARRHTPDAYFLPRLRVEVAALARVFPEGFLVRLHTLGDFYSVEYVLAWAEMLALHPALAVFGYTARRVDDEDPETRRIARAIALLTEGRWERFAIRTSHRQVGRQHSVVVDEDPKRSDTVVCPAQTEASECCSTCGLCWSPAARDKTIAFLRHGMTTRRAPRAPKLVETRAPEPTPLRTGKGGRLPPPMPEGSPQAPGFSAYQTASMAKVLAALVRTGAGQPTVTISFSVLSREAGVPHGSISFLLDSLAKRGLIAIERGTDRRPNTYTLLGAAAAAEAASAPPGNQSKPEPVQRDKVAAEPEGTRSSTTPPAAAPSPEVAALRQRLASEINLSTPALKPVSSPAELVAAPVARVMRERADVDLSAALEPETADGPKTLLTLRASECKWPTGAATGMDQQFCGEPAVGPYCPKHFKLSLPPGKQGTKAARP